MQLKRSGIVAVVVAVWLAGVASIQATPAEQRAVQAVGATVIAESLPIGFRVTAVAVEYNEPLDVGSSPIASSAYTVLATPDPRANIPPGPRTIIRAYTNSTSARAAQSRPGRFVILELSPTDANAPGNYYQPNSILLDLREAYRVRQVEAIRTRSVTVAPGEAPIAPASVVRPVVDDFVAHTYVDPNGVSLDYRQFSPAAAKGGPAGQRFPLVFALHGLGSSGTDNVSQLVGESMAVPFALPERQATAPAFIIAPQRKEVAMGTGWRAPELQVALGNLVKKAMETLPIDPTRVYLVGLSMGGNGGWTILREHRAMFAGALLTAGFGVLQTDVANVKDLPMWISHATDDKLTPYDAAGAPLRAMRALDASGTPVIFAEWAANLPVADANARASAQLAQASDKRARHLFTTYTAGTNPVFGHGSWIPMFSTPVILDWLFAQRLR